MTSRIEKLKADHDIIRVSAGAILDRAEVAGRPELTVYEHRAFMDRLAAMARLRAVVEAESGPQ